MPVADKRVGGSFTHTDHRQPQPLGKLHRHILHGVHGDIGPPLQQGVLQLLDEQPLATDLGQRGVEDFVAAGFDLDQFHRDAGVVALQLRLDIFGLPECQQAARVAMRIVRGH